VFLKPYNLIILIETRTDLEILPFKILG
jgi:hypothetical protein